MPGVLFACLLLLVPAAGAQSWAIDDCGLEPPGSIPEGPPVPRKPWEPVVSPETPALVRADPIVARIGGTPSAFVRGQGALAGKVIYLSPGHGFTWSGPVADWRTQRGNTNDIVEDLVSVETVSQYLMPMLLNAGARVVSVRELDLNSSLVIVDNGEAGYGETGFGFSNSTIPGWGRPTLPMSGATLPFSLGSNRLMAAANVVTSEATYTASIATPGYYEISVSYTSFSARVTDAHYVIRHAGGETSLRVNQQRHGGTWVQLGRFYLRPDRPAQVVVLNDSTAPAGSNISLDAVKFGGGSGIIDRGSGPSGRPRFEESARYHAQFAGAPAAVWAPSSNAPADDRNNDIGARSRFAAWVHEPGEDAVYVAWHTNGANGTAVGTNTYVYGPNPVGGSYDFTGVPGSDRLARLIHAELLNDLRAPSGWNRPSWFDRGVDSAYFGELNPTNNPETPAVLLEVAFHDTASDAAQLKEPAFRYLAARAIAQGVIKYFAQKDGVASRLPPETPTEVVALNQGGDEVLVRWHAPETDTEGVRGEAATAYRVYASDDGLSWDDGVEVNSTSARRTLPPGGSQYFRVTALNAGGESFPSIVVGARRAVSGKPLALIVNGFDRLEAAMAKREVFASRYALGEVLRIFIERMNDGSAARLSGQALAANDIGFDIAQSRATTSGAFDLGPYQMMTWVGGRGKQGGGGLTPMDQGVVKSFRQRDLPVFLTGAEATDTAFIAQVFSGSVPGTTGRLQIRGEGPFSGLSAQLDDGMGGSFDTGTPPAVEPSGSAMRLAGYASGGGAAIGVAGESVMFGFPFETLIDPATRVEVMRRVLAFLSPGPFDGGYQQVDAGRVTEPDGGTGQDGGRVDADGGANSDAGTSPFDGGGSSEDPDGGSNLPPGYFGGGGCSAAASVLPLLGCLALLGFGRRRSGTAAKAPRVLAVEGSEK